MDPNLMMEALTRKLEHMLNGKFDGLHGRLDRIEHTRSSSSSSNPHGQRRDRGLTRRTHDGYYEENFEEENEFIGGYGQHRWDRQGQGRGDDGLSRINMESPSFQGNSDPAAYLKWERKMELVFDCRNYSEVQKVKLAVTKFIDYALSWWDQLVTSRRRNRERPLETWAEMKAVMRKRFVPSRYSKDLKEMVHKAVRVEQQLKRRGTSRTTSNFQDIPWAPSYPKKEEKVQVNSKPKPKVDIDNLGNQGKSEVVTTRVGLTKCAECQSRGHIDSQCLNHLVKILGDSEECESKKEEDIDSMPTLGDISNEEHVVQDELLVARRSTLPLENTDGEEHAVQKELVGAKGDLNVRTKENQFKDLEHHDFIGIEHILSKCGLTKTITSYEEERGELEVNVTKQVSVAFQISRYGDEILCATMQAEPLFLGRQWQFDRRSKASKYSKYLFGWSGRCQYWSNKDPMNSRTNSFQEWGNDENMAGLQTWNADPIQVLKGKDFRVALNGLIQEVLNQACPKRPLMELCKSISFTSPLARNPTSTRSHDQGVLVQLGFLLSVLLQLGLKAKVSYFN